MTAGILFFNHGAKHIARLVVAIHSLRKVAPSAAVCVLDTGEASAAEIMAKIGSDDELFVGVKQFKMQMLRRNSAYCAKSSLWRHSPFEHSLLVDSDVLFLKSPQPLLDAIADRSKPGFLVTQFSDWVTTGKTIGGRLKKWHDVTCEGMNVRVMELESLIKPHPAINTGVVGMRSDDHESRETLRAWESLTYAGQRNTFTDELAAQLLIRHYPHQLVEEVWNSSVLYGKDRENAAILHMHGGKHLRPEAGGRWIAEYRECCAVGVARIQEWGPTTDANLAALT